MQLRGEHAPDLIGPLHSPSIRPAERAGQALQPGTVSRRQEGGKSEVSGWKQEWSRAVYRVGPTRVCGFIQIQ